MAVVKTPQESRIGIKVANGTSASSNTIATFNTPGTYVLRLGVTDGVFDPNQYGPVTRDLQAWFQRRVAAA